ncbi:RNA polymerase factor sigma-54 [Xylella taiwanensis]|uniref:RNA polymerase sigma-54 factor n=2 Tax=Xylella taiwanensis TaxID=1444770 RepID=A0ABS8TT76_9GAMM|nr:RNA polymerase factor sigma-54 [Xylella taiwanensis]AXI83951.1 RNA polymerase sigma54 factor [Xylella taiwanensis]MCD8457057.1 RNA polymerase factor sigma-54 [Xylella taiwanensis]MCD8459467.1 RNA polymerase factor sigma-54 [Xylella taiwanensis]MCD8461664.1 RNA polymerase factor sigma-54 [Xylella taiwanensis]MCD8462308.1 RNA polymerase factor sigma-54 [Xylella taiwanensis]
MKATLRTSMGQQLVMTPQLHQAIRLLQMSSTELELEITAAIESNPLLDWAENQSPETKPDAETETEDWHAKESTWNINGSKDNGNDDDNPIERLAAGNSLTDHLMWQLHLSPLSARDYQIGTTLIDALEEDGYLREPLSTVASTLAPLSVDETELLPVLRYIQSFDPTGVAARSLGECLALQLKSLKKEVPGHTLALQIVESPLLQQLPRSGVAGLARELKLPSQEVEQAVQLIRRLDPRPGKKIGDLEVGTYIIPDCVIWRQRGLWHAALSERALPQVVIHHGYEQLINRCDGANAGYLRSQLQQARWLLKSLEARGATLLKVVNSLLRHQTGFLEFGEQALRPLTIRELAIELGLHESTVSRAIAGKYVRTPRGTLPLRAFFASGIGTHSGEETSNCAIQAMIRRLIETENPRKPLSDAKLAELLKTSGISVARRTIAKYRDAMNISASHERVRVL